MLYHVLDNVSPRVWVFLSFDVENGGPSGEKRGRLSIQFVEPEKDFVNFSLHQVECWSRVLSPFIVHPEVLSSEHRAEVALNEAQTNERITATLASGYEYLSSRDRDQNQTLREDENRWVEGYNNIAETMSSFSRQITFSEVIEVRPHNPLPEPLSSSRIWTISGSPTVQIRAGMDEWTRLHDRVQRLPDLAEMAPTFVNDSLKQVTEGMVRVFGDGTHRRSNDVICPYRRNSPTDFFRVLPRWIYDICQFDGTE
ncbi:hypothetical protein CkaCkLH20_03838 [Colletotrichum karsti]|uniref:Uncharacterized protein n=1 Tax=Colletotrichum karsti TaxID=1095194 RepID=A0A9P6LMK9_9PEZI|nr:uncharacterized protein CkaCkLH20_03838 [Colletotrichum karsti]KAF9878938.1 hypothetical protein CkaCkLH20_03838 [Colletotrichum karsti]